MAPGKLTLILLFFSVFSVVSGEGDWYEFGNNHLALREFMKRQSECVPKCESAEVPELCRIECIHPGCAKKAKASKLFDDKRDTGHARFHAAFRQCAETEFAQSIGNKEL